MTSFKSHRYKNPKMYQNATIFPSVLRFGRVHKTHNLNVIMYKISHFFICFHILPKMYQNMSFFMVNGGIFSTVGSSQFLSFSDLAKNISKYELFRFGRCSNNFAVAAIDCNGAERSVADCR